MFPQEIIDLIVDQLRTSPFALKSCSLVSSRWAARSREHLFARVAIRSDRLRLWCWNITPGPTGVSRYTTHLLLLASANHADDEAWFEPDPLIHASDHFASFTNVHTLDIIRWKFLDEEEYTASFTQVALTIRILRITAPILDTPAFLSFVTFFNRAESVHISQPRTTAEQVVALDLVPAPGTFICWKSLHLLDFSITSLPLLVGIAQLPIQLVDLSVGLYSPYYHDDFFTVLLQACSGTLQTLRLCRSAGGKAPSLKFSSPPTHERLKNHYPRLRLHTPYRYLLFPSSGPFNSALYLVWGGYGRRHSCP